MWLIAGLDQTEKFQQFPRIEFITSDFMHANNVNKNVEQNIDALAVIYVGISRISCIPHILSEL